MPTDNLDKTTFLRGSSSKKMLAFNIAMALSYFFILAFAFDHGNIVLFSLLIAGEVFHLFQIIGYSQTIWSKKIERPFDRRFSQPVDVFITVCGEPVEIVRETAIAARDMDYPTHQVYLLNDGLVAGKDNWRDIVKLAEELGIKSITRKKGGGAKAGNINSGLRHSTSPYFVVFDADHIPHKNFLRKTMGYFTDKKVGFVQTPQFYKNQSQNVITQTSWDQQTLFFGPIMAGKDAYNSAFMCGTNMVLSREAILQAGGMCEFNIAEDFLTSLFVHNNGWKSVYVPEVLAEGLAPEDFLNYYKQQFRWTRGSLEVIFKYNPLFMRGLTITQRFQYLVSASYYLSGVIVLMNIALPLLFLYTGLTAITTATMALAMIFLPYIAVNLYVMQKSSGYTYTFNAISFSVSAFYLQLKAVLAVLLNQKTAFAVTEKGEREGNFIKLATPHLIYIALSIIGLGIGLVREGFSASLMANASWIIVNVSLFIPFILASLPQSWAITSILHSNSEKQPILSNALASGKDAQ
jgi:cellulose synthase (UDP-forming)